MAMRLTNKETINREPLKFVDIKYDDEFLTTSNGHANNDDENMQQTLMLKLMHVVKQLVQAILQLHLLIILSLILVLKNLHHLEINLIKLKMKTLMKMMLYKD